MQTSVRFVIPAHNEAALLGRTVEALRKAAADAGIRHEIIVASDASTDATPDVARAHGASVVELDRRHIAAARNAGADGAETDALIFVDADTIVPGPTLRAAITALERGIRAGSARVRFEGRYPLVSGMFFMAFLAVWQGPLRLPAGCFVFIRREDFERIGGWDERYYAGEELTLRTDLGRSTPWTVLREPVYTSARKLRMHGSATLIALAIRTALRGPRGLRSRHDKDVWYDGRRETSPDGRRTYL